MYKVSASVNTIVEQGGMTVKYSDEFETEEEKKKGSKGFYIALAVCLIAICGVAVTTFVSTLPTDEPKGDGTTTAPIVTTTKPAQQVVKPATDIKDDRPVTTVVPTTATTGTKAADLFVFPVSNRVLRPFSNTHYFSETLGEWITHNGVDFAAEAGDNVKAAADGKIAGIRKDALWGDVIEIKHDGNMVTRYCGVTPASIAEGQTVKAGDVIGVIADVPAEVLDPAHLHMELVVNEKHTDPLTLIQGKTVSVTTAATTTTKK